MKLRILYEDEDLVAVDKPAGLIVHRHAIHSTRGSALQILSKQIGKSVYLAHRLDRATSGVLLFTKSSEFAALMQGQWKSGTVKKTYIALIRGWLSESNFVIDAPLDGRASLTKVETLHRFELPVANKKFPTSRYSIVAAYPETGRMHQIRRHLKSCSHPIIGDTVYGDGVHNLIFRKLTEDQLLYLKAAGLKIQHPRTGEELYFRSTFRGEWHRIFDLAGFCPKIEGPLK